jgi:hypothetical protein
MAGEIKYGADCVVRLGLNGHSSLAGGGPVTRTIHQLTQAVIPLGTLIHVPHRSELDILLRNRLCVTPQGDGIAASTRVVVWPSSVQMTALSVSWAGLQASR